MTNLVFRTVTDHFSWPGRKCARVETLSPATTPEKIFHHLILVGFLPFFSFLLSQYQQGSRDLQLSQSQRSRKLLTTFPRLKDAVLKLYVVNSRQRRVPWWSWSAPPWWWWCWSSLWWWRWSWVVEVPRREWKEAAAGRTWQGRRTGPRRRTVPEPR